MSELSTALRYLKGAGPARAQVLERLELRTLGDLLEHYPRGYLDRTHVTPLGRLAPGPDVTAGGTVRSVSVRRARGRQDLHAILEDATGHVECVWFNQPYLAQRLKRGTRLLVSGRVEFFRGLRFSNPEMEILDAPEESNSEPDPSLGQDGSESPPRAPAQGISPGAPGIVPVYPLTAGISQRMLRRLVRQALQTCESALREFMPAELLQRHQLLAWREAHWQIHFPDSAERLRAARRRIGFQELFDLQLLLAIARSERARPASARPLCGSGEVLTALRGLLPFTLTAAQERAVTQIRADLARDCPMQRLLEGDVGSGKTLVAIASALLAVEAGAQVAFMAPTEILAAQHARTLAQYGSPLGVRSALLVGGLAARHAREIREQVQAGEIDVLIGTHALIQESVAFRALGLVIVDEQHRFGVEQRARLLGKGAAPHALIMTATPIPRTLALALFGDLDLTVLDEKPPGRVPPRTHRVPSHRYADLLGFVARALSTGAQAYFVCPMIAASEDSDLRAAEELHARLQADPVLGRFRGALLHGRMKAEEKAAVMQAFSSREVAFLVSTTVIEVGVDVPNASLMVIEHPERYGLSQLHQLRGRVGRGRQPAHLFLIQRRGVGPEARQRLEILVREDDGFRIAEEDLRQRGPGDFFGVRQSGLPPLKVADPIREPRLLEDAREAAFGWAAAAQSAELRRGPLWSRLAERFGERLRLYGIG